MDALTKLTTAAISKEFLHKLPREFARAHAIVSQGIIDNCELLVIASDTDPAAVWNTRVRLRRDVKTEICGREEILQILDAAYGSQQNDSVSLASPQSSSLEELLKDADRDLLKTQGKAPLVQLVDALLLEANHRRASDLHLHPMTEKTLVRYRIDGVLQTVREVTNPVGQAVVSRLKVMGKMDIAEKRVPQDGRASVKIGDRSLDLRMSSFPGSCGERFVVRILDPQASLADFELLGMPPSILDHYLSGCARSNGLILVTGPTGSGKTTTLYATLRKIAAPALNILTIEDPIEYELASAGLAISQSQVNVKKGITFATGLRHLLRQDPDVIFVGEIRDAETARMAIQASLTGHLVFSTLHTNDCASAVTRLVDLGVEPFLVSASLTQVLAQRLVRTVHRPCSGNGCAECLHSGYLGRVGVFEHFVVDSAIREIITKAGSLQLLQDAAKRNGMKTLEEEARRLVREGVTTETEFARVVSRDAQ